MEFPRKKKLKYIVVNLIERVDRASGHRGQGCHDVSIQSRYSGVAPACHRVTFWLRHPRLLPQRPPLSSPRLPAAFAASRPRRAPCERSPSGRRLDFFWPHPAFSSDSWLSPILFDFRGSSSLEKSISVLSKTDSCLSCSTVQIFCLFVCFCLEKLALFSSF